ncbi:MAG: hypothetical protein GY822_18470 [Deltaproteobacteria bacterium]|nr:hypothetical protein [Deltaproteobacteria bacterium]
MQNEEKIASKGTQTLIFARASVTSGRNRIPALRPAPAKRDIASRAVQRLQGGCACPQFFFLKGVDEVRDGAL